MPNSLDEELFGKPVSAYKKLPEEIRALEIAHIELYSEFDRLTKIWSKHFSGQRRRQHCLQFDSNQVEGDVDIRIYETGKGIVRMALYRHAVQLEKCSIAEIVSDYGIKKAAIVLENSSLLLSLIQRTDTSDLQRASHPYHGISSNNLHPKYQSRKQLLEDLNRIKSYSLDEIIDEFLVP